MMEWFWMAFMIAFGWKTGVLIFEWFVAFVEDAPEGIQKIHKYRKRKQNRKTANNETTYKEESRRP